MRPTEINMQIVKNLGNYETVRLGVTYELSDTDIPEKSFKIARQVLEKSFIEAYEEMINHNNVENKNDSWIDEMEMEIMEAKNMEDGFFDTKNMKLNDKQFKRIMTALRAGAINLTGIEQDFALTKEQREQLYDAVGVKK